MKKPLLCTNETKSDRFWTDVNKGQTTYSIGDLPGSISKVFIDDKEVRFDIIFNQESIKCIIIDNPNEDIQNGLCIEILGC